MRFIEDHEAFSGQNQHIHPEAINNNVVLGNNPELIVTSSFDSIPLDTLRCLIAEKEKQMKEKEILAKYPIKQLPDGRFWTRVNGVKKTSFNRKKLERKIINMVTGDVTFHDKATIEDIFDTYIAARRYRVSETTWVNDLKYKNFYLVSSEIYKKSLKKITLDDAYAFFEHVKSRKKELANDPKSRVTPELKQKYWNNVRGFMNGILEYAIECRYCDYNPFKNMCVHTDAFSPAKKTSKADAVFSDDEQYRICALADKDSECKKDALPLAIPLLFQTALRDGELVALKWSDIDGKWLHIQRELSGVVDEEGYIRGRCIKARCKTAKSIRIIELSKDAQKLLKRIKQLNTENGYPTEADDFVFYRTFKGFMTTCTERCFAGRLSKYCKQAKMQVIKSPHDARRTCLTNMYKNGVSLAYIQAFAGHENQKQTEQYLKLTIKDIAQNDNTSCLNMDSEKLEAYKRSDIRNKVIPLKKRA